MRPLKCPLLNKYMWVYFLFSPIAQYRRALCKYCPVRGIQNLQAVLKPITPKCTGLLHSFISIRTILRPDFCFPPDKSLKFARNNLWYSVSRYSHIIIRNPIEDKQRILALNNIFDLQGHQRTLGTWIARIEEFSGFLAELIISHNILHSSKWQNNEESANYKHFQFRGSQRIRRKLDILHFADINIAEYWQK